MDCQSTISDNMQVRMFTYLDSSHITIPISYLTRTRCHTPDFSKLVIEQRLAFILLSSSSTFSNPISLDSALYWYRKKTHFFNTFIEAILMNPILFYLISQFPFFYQDRLHLLPNSTVFCLDELLTSIYVITLWAALNGPCGGRGVICWLL